MEVRVKFFGVVRDITDDQTAVVELDNDATLMDLLNALHKKYGKRFYDGVLSDSSGLKGHVKLFLNHEEVDRKELATTKVVSGGVAAETMLFLVPSTAGG